MRQFRIAARLAESRIDLSTIEPARSITHQHLLCVAGAEWRRTEATDRVWRLLDLGCGDGSLLVYLTRNLPRLHPQMRLEVYGFDVYDHGVQPEGFMANTVASLESELPTIPWTERISSIAADSPWPYPNEFFDAILSNQVLEHVADHDLLFAETHRTLRPDGFAAHLFPLRHYLYEGHLLLPLVHRIADFDLLRSYITWTSRLGLGKYRIHRRQEGVTLADYAERHADYMHHFTNYLTHKEALQLGKRHHLRPSFRYTREFYSGRLRALLHLSPRHHYAIRRSALADRLALSLYKYISGVTLLLTKKQTY